MEVNERLRMVMDSHRLTAGAFADRIGVQRSNVSHILSGRNKPSFEFVEKLLKAFPRVSAEWLLTGKQNMSKIDNLPTPMTPSSVTNVTNEPQEDLPKDVIVVNNANEKTNTKKIVKTVVFYSDFTFDVYLPNEQ